MQTMMEQITLTENRAEEIRQKAALDARESIAGKKIECDNRLQEAEETERTATKLAVSQAETDGAALADAIKAQAEREIEKKREIAEQRIPQAVAYLLERAETLQ
ncbi:MAG: hypothetical protein Q4C04_07385 [Clostridia bacterium]|nr:hypothetical protein [Clostridia bacterium]